MSFQELDLEWIQPCYTGATPVARRRKGVRQISRSDPEQLDACRYMAGMNIRKAISRLSKLTCLSMRSVSFQDIGSHNAAHHPWTHLK